MFHSMHRDLSHTNSNLKRKNKTEQQAFLQRETETANGSLCPLPLPEVRPSHLAGLGIDVPSCEELLHNPHVLGGFHSCERRQHDGRVARFVLLIHVTHLCGDGGRCREEKGACRYLSVVLANSLRPH